MMCAALMVAALSGNAYKVIMTYDDGKTVAAAGMRVDKTNDNYLALSATTDTTTERILQARGYAQTEVICLIGKTEVHLYAQEKLVSNKI